MSNFNLRIFGNATRPHQRSAFGTCRQIVRPVALVAGLAAGLLLSLPDRAAAQEALNDFAWFKQDTATGDWGGVRTDIENFGVTPELNYTTDLMTNPVGGMNQSGAYAGAFTGSLTFDFGKIAGIQGLSLFAAGSLQQGRDLTGDDVGNVFAVAQIFNGDVARLNQLYLQQSLWNDALNIAVGRLAAGDDFAAADSYGYYVSGAVNGNPTPILVNTPSFTTSPFTQWGARATVKPTQSIYVSAGVYNADPSVQEDEKNGVDFKFNPDDGVLVVGEVGYDLNQEKNAKGLPGTYAAGFVYDSSDYAKFDNPDSNKSGNYSFYAFAEQQVYAENSSGDGQGLSVWGTATFAPDEDINTLPYGLFGGGYYQGLIPTRDNDVTAMALYWGLFSDDLPGQSYELVLEATHRFQLAPWLYFQPDFQYIFNPNGGGIDDAAVFGVEISVDF